MPMLTADEAGQIILDALQPPPTEIIPFAEVLGRVLADDLIADAPVPRFPQSAMDGFALRSADTLEATSDRPVALCILGTLAAGHQASWTLSPGTAVRIMTGAPIPSGANAVVKREDTEFDAESVRILGPVLPNDHIIPPGRDIPQGTTLLPAGEAITAWGIGLCASLGKTHVRVYRRPRVGILALGDQLDMIEGALRRAGDVDLLLTLGGSQRGDFDLVDDLLSGRRGHMIFRGIAANYARSMIFGRFRGTPLCGLPGSPITSLVAFEVFVRPAIWKSAGRRRLTPVRVEAALDGRLPPTEGRTHFQPVWLEARPPGVIAAPLDVRQAPGLPPQMLANGLIRRPPGSPACPAGDRVWVDVIETP